MTNEDIELVKDGNIVIHSNEIEAALFDAMELLEIDDLLKVSQRRWKACLMIVGNKLFKDTDLLRLKDAIYPTTYNGKTTYNSWDIEKVEKLLDYYMFLSAKYDKVISIEAFSYLSAIPMDTILNWKGNEPSKSSFHIWKKLHDSREINLADKMIDNNSIVGAIAVANKEYGWNTNLETGEQINQDNMKLSDTKMAFEQFQIEQNKGE